MKAPTNGGFPVISATPIKDEPLNPVAIDAVALDPNDPFEAALIPMVQTNRKKRADYAHDGDIFSNFDSTSNFAGFETRWMSALFNCSQKLARISALRGNGRLDDPANEAVEDTLLDNAVYGVIALAIFMEDKANAQIRRALLVEQV